MFQKIIPQRMNPQRMLNLVIVWFALNVWVHHLKHFHIVNIIFIMHVLINGFNQVENNLVQLVDMFMELVKVF
jgi:hypothetical protein